MPTLLLTLKGPVQSYGISSRVSRIVTESYPTKSAVVGLIAAALGRQRSDSIKDISACLHGVRIDKPGFIKYEFCTAQNVVKASGKGAKTDEDDDGSTTIRYKGIIQDAAYVVGVEGDREILEKIEQALLDPTYEVTLGRKSCIPSKPLVSRKGGNIVDLPLFDALKAFDTCHMKHGYRTDDIDVRFVLETERGRLVHDQPLSFHDRTFLPRWIQETVLTYTYDGDKYVLIQN